MAPAKQVPPRPPSGHVVGQTDSYLDGRALRRRYDSALKRADIRRVQEWMGHADIQTTMKYLHYAPRKEDAVLVAEAFRP